MFNRTYICIVMESARKLLTIEKVHFHEKKKSNPAIIQNITRSISLLCQWRSIFDFYLQLELLWKRFVTETIDDLIKVNSLVYRWVKTKKLIDEKTNKPIPYVSNTENPSWNIPSKSCSGGLHLKAKKIFNMFQKQKFHKLRRIKHMKSICSSSNPNFWKE